MNNLKKLICGLAIAGFAQVSTAEPITGNLQFFGSGTFLSSDGVNNLDGSGNGRLDLCNDGVTLIPDSTGGDCSAEGGIESGPATGFDFGAVPFGPDTGLVASSGGTLNSFYNVTGLFMDLVDVDLNNLPQTEFNIDMSPSGFDAILSFIITTGTETDTGDAGTWDIGGTGYFDFVCNVTDDPNCESVQTNGTWSISNTGADLIVGFNAVPAPSVLGLLGLGLLGLGVVRARRKA